MTFLIDEADSAFKNGIFLAALLENYKEGDSILFAAAENKDLPDDVAERFSVKTEEVVKMDLEPYFPPEMWESLKESERND